MKIEKLIDKEIERHEETMKTLRKAEEIQQIADIDFVNNKTMSLTELPYSENIKTLSRLKKAGHTLDFVGYYGVCNCLALKYRLGDLYVIFFNTDAKHALSKVSKGRCEFKKVVHHGSEVVCNV